jgi:hypothetical protein
VKLRDDSAKMDVELAQLTIHDALARSHFRSLICPIEQLQHSSLPLPPASPLSSIPRPSVATSSMTSRRMSESKDGTPRWIPSSSPSSRGSGSVFSFDSPLSSSSTPISGSGNAATINDALLFRASVTYFFAPAEHQPHMKVTAMSGSLAIVINPLCYQRIQRFVMIQQITDTLVWEELQVSAFNAFSDLRQRVESKLEYILNTHIRMQLDINLQAPTIILHHSHHNDTGSFIAIRLGQLTITQATALDPPISSRSSMSLLPSSHLPSSATSSPTVASSRALLSTVDENSSRSPMSEPPSSPPSILPSLPLSARLARDREVSFQISPLASSSSLESRDTDGSTSSSRRGSTRQPLHIRVPSALALSSQSSLSSPAGSISLGGVSASGSNGHISRDSMSHDKLSRLLYDVFLVRIADIAIQLVPISCLSQWIPFSSSSSSLHHSPQPSLSLPPHIYVGKESVVHLVQGITAEVSISISVLPSDTSVTRARIVGRLSPLTAIVTSSQYVRIADIAANLLPLTKTNTTPTSPSGGGGTTSGTDSKRSTVLNGDSLLDTFSVLEPSSPSVASHSKRSRDSKKSSDSKTTSVSIYRRSCDQTIHFICYGL